jgi:hypothetical protein
MAEEIVDDPDRAGYAAANRDAIYRMITGTSPGDLMGIWQAPLTATWPSSPRNRSRACCQIDAFPELGAGCPRRDRQDLAGMAGMAGAGDTFRTHGT